MIKFLSVAPGILIQSGQEAVEDVESWASCLNDLSSALIEARMTTEQEPQWCVSSIRRTLTGKDRLDAKSHKSGQALDLAPVYSSTHVTSPDRSTPSLAVNLFNLAKIARLVIPGHTIVVEGDHLHIVPRASQIKGVVTYPTLTPWYNAGAAFEADSDIAPMLQKFFVFEVAAMTFRPATESEVQGVWEALSSEKAVE